MEYADCYRNGATEGEIYEEIGGCFKRVARQFGLRGFGKNAYAHHPGGPVSPMGNRDYLLEAGSKRKVFPWMRFAINPVDLLSNLKVEIEGIATEQGGPIILDESKYTPSRLMTYSEITTNRGTTGKVADLIVR